jgi:site-specific DNA recombinase
VACYCRYSSDNQREESIHAQRRAIEDFCEKNNMTLVNVYIDEALSATNDDREQFLKMIEDSASRRFGAVIVHKLDRFARNRYDSAFYKKRLKDNGVKLISVLEPLDDSPESIILESVLEGMAEYYSKNLSREVRKGMGENAQNAVHNGGIPALGYDIDENKKHVLNEREAESIRFIFEKFLEGWSYRRIAEELNAMGYRSKLGRPFKAGSITDLLINEKYTGVYVFNKRAKKGTNRIYKDDSEIVRIDGAVPQIVDKETFQKVQEKLKANRRGPRIKQDRVYLLTGSIYCGLCGKTYNGNSYVYGRGNVKNYTYACSTHQKSRHDCTGKTVRKDLIEAFVLDQIKEHVLNDTAIEKIAAAIKENLIKKYKSLSANLKTYEDNKISIEARLNKLVDLYLDGSLDKSLYNSKSSELKTQLADIDLKIKDASRINLNMYSLDKISDFIRSYDLDNADNETKVKLIQTFVDRVTVYPDKITVDIKIDMDRGLGGGGEPLHRIPLSIPTEEFYNKKAAWA